MFQFPGLALSRYTFSVPGFPIRKSSDQGLCASPRSLSQLITSFIASESQGIRRLLLLTFLVVTLIVVVRNNFVILLPVFQRTQSLKAISR